MLALLLLRVEPPLAGWDKAAAHFFVFALITALLVHGTAGQAPLAVLGAVVGFAALDEVQRLLMPGRSAELADFIADAAAAAAVCGLASLKREKPSCVELSRPSPAATSSRS